MVNYEPTEKEREVKGLLMQVLMDALKKQGYKVKLVKPKITTETKKSD